MSKIEVSVVDDRKLTVNGKEVFKDMNDNWICNLPLYPNEIIALNNYINNL